MRVWARCLVICTLLPSAAPALAGEPDGVNAIVGDASWIARFGQAPSADADPIERIRTHLEYVEGWLRQEDVSRLTAAQRARRHEALDVLAEYRRAGRFPINDERAERSPRFIDAHGTLCAVGRLIEATDGLDAARAIKRAHEWDYVLDMHEPMITAWAEKHGFTLEELAMIQPSYAGQPDMWTATLLYGLRTSDGPARPRRRTLERDLAAVKPLLEACVRDLREKTPGPVEVTLDAEWLARQYPIRVAVSVAPADDASIACIQAKLDRYMAKKYPNFFTAYPTVRATALLRFEQAKTLKSARRRSTAGR